ncbi:MAG: trehalose-phosphatase [Actinomycetes bacterium]
MTAPVVPVVWDPFVAAPAQAALLLDFDGTLAPIVDDPARAEPLPEAVDACTRSAAHFGLVAVVTGRPVAFVRRHLPDRRIRVVGQYGLEREVDGVVVVDPRARSFAAAVAAATAEAAARWPALRVEPKGDVACTVHWREAPTAAPDLAELAGLAARHGLEPWPARMACELRPPVPVDKSSAVSELLADFVVGTSAAFAGDDHGDLAAFAGVTAWAAAAAGRVALRIAVASPESPVELTASADLACAGPSGLARVLVGLADALDAG